MPHPGGVLVSLSSSLVVIAVALSLELHARRAPPDEAQLREREHLARMHEYDAPCAALDALQPRRPGIRRVAIAGESNGTFFAEDLVAASEDCPEAGLEIVPCAVPAAGPRQTALQLRRLMDADVDEVVVVFGNNHHVAYPEPSPALRLRELVASSRALWNLSRAWFPRPAPLKPAVEPLWEEAFEAIRETGRTRPVRVVVPSRNPWALHGTPDPLVHRAAWWLTVGDPARAVRTLTEDGQLRPTWLAVAHAAAGDVDAARAALATAPAVLPQLPTFQARYRAFLDESGVPWIDLTEWLADRSAIDPPGWNVFFDGSHLQNHLYRELATELWPLDCPPRHVHDASAMATTIASSAATHSDPIRPYGAQRFYQASLAATQALRGTSPSVAADLPALLPEIPDAETRWGMWDGWHAVHLAPPPGTPAPTCDDAAACTALLRAAVRLRDRDTVARELPAALRRFPDDGTLQALAAMQDELLP